MTYPEEGEKVCCWTLRRAYEACVTAAYGTHKSEAEKRWRSIDESKAFQALVQHKRNHNI